MWVWPHRWVTFAVMCPLPPSELYENLGYVGASIKHHLVEGMRNMWQQLNDLARSHTTGPQSTDQEELSVEPGQHSRVVGVACSDKPGRI